MPANHESTMKRTIILSVVCALATVAHGAARSSASYALTDTLDAGGARASSASYVNEGSLGQVAGISAAAGQQVLRNGFIGQLYDISNVTASVSDTNVNEATATQVTLTAWLDDGTLLVPEASALALAALSGPVGSISPNAQVTMTNVYQDTLSTVRASYMGFTSTLMLLVKNMGQDDCGTYASDGIADDWQVQHFGLNNPNAGPDVDASGTGQNNLFKYTAGLNPLDPASVFTLRELPPFGSIRNPRVYFQPWFSNRTYTVQYRTNLGSGAFLPLTSTSVSNTPTGRIITDLTATNLARYYRVRITYP